MTQHDDLDAFEQRLQSVLDVSLPAAPATLLERLHGVPVSRLDRAPGRFGLLLVPAAIAAVLVGAFLAAGTGPRPLASASPSPIGSTGAFEPVTIGGIDGPAIMFDVWAFGSGFAGMLWGFDGDAERVELVRSEDGRRWTLIPPPRVGFVAAAGVPANGQLHVLGYTGTFDDPVWWHEVMDRDGGWRELGKVTGMPSSSHAYELSHASSGWLTRVAGHSSDPEQAGRESQLRYSIDGLHWIDPAVPTSHQAPPFYTGVGTDGDALLVFRHYDVYASIDGVQTLNTPSPAPDEVLRTTDGRGWTVDNVTFGNGPLFMAFDGRRFVGIGSIPLADVPDEWHAAAWYSDRGKDWHPGFLRRPEHAVSDSIRAVTASLQGGFTAVGSTYGEIWTSADGLTWQVFSALGPGETWNPYAVAAQGDEIVVAGNLPDGTAAVWVRRVTPAILQ